MIFSTLFQRFNQSSESESDNASSSWAISSRRNELYRNHTVAFAARIALLELEIELQPHLSAEGLAVLKKSLTAALAECDKANDMLEQFKSLHP